MENTVLLVDDERNILDSLDKALGNEGYGILKAGSGAEAIRHLMRNRVSLVIADLRLPGMDGAEFLAKLKEAYPDTVRFVLVGHEDLKDAVALKKCEAARYIIKPWNDDELKGAVKEAIERFNLVAENRKLSETVKKQGLALKDLSANLEKKVDEKTRKIKENFFAFVKIFSNMMELYDRNVGGRSRRVAAMARKLSAKMGFDGSDGELIETAALLHNIGLIGLPREMIDRDEDLLTADERELLMHFPKVSQDLLSSVDTLRQAGIIIRGCMERFDGKGWPDGLKGEEIHIGSQIIAISAFYDRFRHGAKRLTPREVLIKIMEERGRAFDPVVADAFFGFLGEWIEEERAFASESDGPEVARFHITGIRAGMVLAENLTSAKGRLLVTKGTVMTEALIERVLKFHQIEPVADCACIIRAAARA